MSMNNTDTKKTKSVFDEDFEVIYEGDLPDFSEEPANDGYKDVLSQLADLDDDTKDIDYLEENHTRPMRPTDTQKYMEAQKKARGEGKNRRKSRRIPNLFSPAAKILKSGGKAAGKTLGKTTSLLLRAITLVLIAAIAILLAWNFKANYLPYGSISAMIAERNYILAAYLGTALLPLLIEGIAFLAVLFGGRSAKDRNGHRTDTGNGLLSFLIIYIGSVLSSYSYTRIPVSPAPLQGVQGALYVYGSLNRTLFILCAAGVISCLARKFVK